MLADLFCRVVDNFGDIGVSWRIARQLHREHDWRIRLWVDDLSAFKRIEPGLDTNLAQQEIHGVDIRSWRPEMPTEKTDLLPYPIVIAAFSCELAPAWMKAMKETGSTWINLEYLSAERWVEDCHGLPSLRQDGLKPYFFFPGFTAKTGGLPREQDLVARRQSWLANQDKQAIFLASIGLPASVAQRFGHTSFCNAEPNPPSGDLDVSLMQRPRLVSLFCYPHAPYQALIDVLSHDVRPSILLVPEGVCPGITIGHIGKLQVLRIPFLSQDEYDHLLWTCDLNVVRGEDSFMRATWAGKPFIWQIYPQQEEAHLTKLDAWLSRAGLPVEAEDCQRSWNHPHHPVDCRTALTTALKSGPFAAWQKSSIFLSDTLSAKPDLAALITAFCRQSIIHPDRIK